jgi:hypothetical protein
MWTNLARPALAGPGFYLSEDGSAPEGGRVRHCNRVVAALMSSGARDCGNDLVGTGPGAAPSGLRCHAGLGGHAWRAPAGSGTAGVVGVAVEVHAAITLLWRSGNMGAAG